MYYNKMTMTATGGARTQPPTPVDTRFHKKNERFADKRGRSLLIVALISMYGAIMMVVADCSFEGKKEKEKEYKYCTVVHGPATYRLSLL